VQWVVTTGRTVEEARERALDALGIDDADLEFEVLDEPRSSLFGLRRTAARIRARVRPTRPRPKVDRRNRRKTATSGGRRRRTKRGADRPDDEQLDDAGDEVAATGGAAPRDETARDMSAGGGRNRRRRGRGTGGDAPDRPSDDDRAVGEADRGTPSAPPPPATSTAEAPAAWAPARASAAEDAPEPAPHDRPESDETPPGATGDSMSDISLDEQEPSAVGFVQGLVAAFGVDASVESQAVDEEHLEISITGADLGLLVGPRGSTLNAIQELTRTAVAQQHSGRLQGRLRVDVAGYRARRKEALERFAAQQAVRVRETGTPVALEPMSPPDRKIVHDAINDIEGVRTTSEGEDRRRHVVILPD